MLLLNLEEYYVTLKFWIFVETKDCKFRKVRMIGDEENDCGMDSPIICPHNNNNNNNTSGPTRCWVMIECGRVLAVPRVPQLCIHIPYPTTTRLDAVRGSPPRDLRVNLAPLPPHPHSIYHQYLHQYLHFCLSIKPTLFTLQHFL